MFCVVAPLLYRSLHIILNTAHSIEYMKPFRALHGWLEDAYGAGSCFVTASSSDRD